MIIFLLDKNNNPNLLPGIWNQIQFPILGNFIHKLKLLFNPLPAGSTIYIQFINLAISLWVVDHHRRLYQPSHSYTFSIIQYLLTDAPLPLLLLWSSLLGVGDKSRCNAYFMFIYPRESETRTILIYDTKGQRRKYTRTIYPEMQHSAQLY